MTKLRQLIDDMRIRMTEIANSDEILVKALGDALERVDEKLLEDVRHVAEQHEARRGAILNELQSLASRICVFPVLREPIAGFSETETYLPSYATSHEAQDAYPRGDWRQAASNIQDELDFHLNGGAPH